MKKRESDSPRIVSCLNVPGGWQSQDDVTGDTFGPVFNKCTDLWAWQRANLPKTDYTAEELERDNPYNQWMYES